MAALGGTSQDTGVGRAPARIDTALDRWAPQLGFEALIGRSASESDEVTRIVEFAREEGVPERRGVMVIGLHLAFAAMAEQALPILDLASCANALSSIPRKASGDGGRAVRTLTLLVSSQGDDATISVGLRRRYEEIKRVVVGSLRRFDYPSSAPHATQSWPDFADNIDAIFAMSPEERRALVEGLWSLIEAMPEHARRTAVRSGLSPFVDVLQGFRPRRVGPSGAVLQGLTYGFMRADAPTLNFATSKVRAGSSRDNRIGDIDGRRGGDIALSAEVKDAQLTEIAMIDDFVANLGEWPDAVAFVVCAGASEEVVRQAADLNITVATRQQLIDAVRLWPIDKQLDGVSAAYEYFVFIESNDPLIRAYEEFLADNEITL